MDHRADMLLSPAEVAAMTGLSRRTVYRKISTGDLRAIRLSTAPNGALRVPMSELTSRLFQPLEGTPR